MKSLTMGSLVVSFLTALTVSAGMAEAPRGTRPVNVVKGHEPSLLPEGQNFRLVWNDEFDGTELDPSKWGYRTNFWGRRANWFAGPDDGSVMVSNGMVALKLIVKNGQYLSPQLQTGELVWDMPVNPARKIFWPFEKRKPAKFSHRYGYYECRCRLQQKPGWWSAFWMQTPGQGATLNPAYSGIEHDIMESFEPGVVIRHCFHYNGYGADHKGFTIPRGKADSGYKLDQTQFHVFGFLWEKDGYTVFIDGKQHGNKAGDQGDEAVSQVPEFLLLTTEAKWYRNENGKGKPVPELKDALGDAFLVDHVRVFDIAE